MIKQQKLVSEEWKEYILIKKQRLLKYRGKRTKTYKLSDDVVFKKCPKCNQWFPYNHEYFYITTVYDKKQNSRISRLRGDCKNCCNNYQNGGEKHRYFRYKYQAKKDNHNFNLTFEECKCRIFFNKLNKC